jgi:hypothetical protein
MARAGYLHGGLFSLGLNYAAMASVYTPSRDTIPLTGGGA